MLNKHRCLHLPFPKTQTMLLLITNYINIFRPRKNHGVEGLIKLFLTTKFGQTWFYHVSRSPHAFIINKNML